jgi:uncharacterized protein
VTPKPSPLPDDVSRFYWDGAREGVLRVTRCANGHLSHPPEPSCPACGSDDLSIVTVSGHGTVFAFTIVRQAFDAAFLEVVPYPVALVALDEDPAVRVLTNLVDVELDDVVVGMAVEVTFEARGDHVIPQFRPSRSAGVPAQ